MTFYCPATQQDCENDDLCTGAQCTLIAPRITSGLSRQELDVMNSLIEAWNRYVEMVPKPEERIEFRHYLHLLQHLIATHAMCRMYPDYWGT